MKIIIALFLFLLSTIVFSKPIYESTQNLMNDAAVKTDTIFKGRVIKKKKIEDGLVLTDSFLNIGILKVEILKVYRGKNKKNKQRFVCTWFDGKEHTFDFVIGKEFTFFGVDTELNIQLPGIYGFVFSSTVTNNELSKALKFKNKPITDRSTIFELFEPSDQILKNACNDPNAWGH